VPTEKSVPVDTVDLAGDHGIRFSGIMSVFVSFLLTLRSCARSRAVLQLEVLALRHQLQVLQRSRPRRLRLSQADRLLWEWFSRVWNEWRAALVIVKPETVLAWHRQGVRRFWTWKSRRRLGRPTVPPDIRSLIRTMVSRESGVGRTADSWRIAETWHRRIPSECVEIHRPKAEAAITDLAHVLGEPPGPDRRHRFLRGAHGDVPAVIRAGVPGPRTSARCAHGRD
jgi:hypothetical protein